MNSMNMGSMNQPDNVIPIVEIGKEVTQEQIKFISTGKASPDFVIKFIKNRINKEEQEHTEIDEYLKSLSMESLILLVKFAEGKRDMSMDLITKFVEEQLIEKAA